MGKKKIAKTEAPEVKEGDKSAVKKAPEAKQVSKRSIASGILYVKSTYNNTLVLLTDKKGNALLSSSAGAMGFKGAKKGTPFAAAKVGEVLGEKAGEMGLREIDVVVKGVGSGRESAIRGFTSKGINITNIKDETPVPHNGPQPKKPRRV